MFLQIVLHSLNCTLLGPVTINNGNRTDWSPKKGGVRFVNHEYDYRLIGRHSVLGVESFLPLATRLQRFRQSSDFASLRDRKVKKQNIANLSFAEIENNAHQGPTSYNMSVDAA